MATNYRKRHISQSRGVALPKRLALLGCAFTIGYLSASLIDLRQLSTWLNTHSPFDGGAAGATSLASKPTPPKPKLEFYTLLTSNHGTSVAPPSTPTYASAKVQQPSTMKVATTSPVAHPIKLTSPPAVIKPRVVVAKAVSQPLPTSKPALARTNPQLINQARTSIQSNKMAYSLQVAAFRNRQDAEHMKASLLLKGFDASIIAIESQRVAWYRVMVGRFSSREQAQKTQTALAARERMNGMIRKMDA